MCCRTVGAVLYICCWQDTSVFSLGGKLVRVIVQHSVSLDAVPHIRGAYCHVGTQRNILQTTHDVE